MTYRHWLRASCAALTTAALLQAPPALATEAALLDHVVEAPRSSDLVHAQVAAQAAEPKLSLADKLALLQKRVKHVFVLFQENRSFDQHFGTFPGAIGLFSQPAAQTPGFVQPIVNTDGSVGTVSPFLIPQTVLAGTAVVPIYPADTDSVDHSHAGIDNSLDLDANRVAHNDRYALDEEGLTTKKGQIVSRSTGSAVFPAPSLAQKQKAELVMGHLDCDTIPFLWQFADRFVLFDNFHQSIIGPSTPNAIAMIAGQSGQTQWVLHPGEGSNNTASPVVKFSGGEPMIGDPGPFAGSNLDTALVKPPYGPNDESPKTPALNQTYASLPLSFLGQSIYHTIASDQNPAIDLPDVQHDIGVIAARNKSVPWGWFQEGYDHEPTDGSSGTTYANYITHHNGPQYFGYVGDNPKMTAKLHGLQDFFTALSTKALPDRGVFYVRGGYGNNVGLKPSDPNPTVQANFTGNDDHPGYSDAQIAEALVAQEVSAIAASPYWKDSAIIITYDETDGLYDHAPVHIRSLDPEGNALTAGPRVPAIVISPYARAHVIDKSYAEHSSVIKFINQLFDLTPLGDLPDEVKGRELGVSRFGQPELGPADSLAIIDDLFGAFDNGRLQGTTPLLPAAYATIPAAVWQSLPPYGGEGCYELNIVPSDYQNGALLDPAPADFNPRPSSTPGTPTSTTTPWTP